MQGDPEIIRHLGSAGSRLLSVKIENPFPVDNNNNNNVCYICMALYSTHKPLNYNTEIHKQCIQKRP